MKKWLTITGGGVLLLVQIINVCFTFNLYKASNVSKHTPMNEVDYTQRINDNSPIMDLQQAAAYLGIEEAQLIRLTLIEKNELEQTGSFTGQMLPYIKIDDTYCFFKEALDLWVYETSKEAIKYDTGKYSRIK